MVSTQLLFGAAGVALLYVVIRLVAVILSPRRRRGMAAYGGIVVTIAAPIAAFTVPRDFGMPAEDQRLFMVGSALWLTLAMAFAAFALSRMPDRGRRHS